MFDSLCCLCSFLYTRPIFGDEVIFDHIGEIGDTIGGLTAPVIGLLNAVLLYLTLREQFEFNEKLNAELIARIGENEL